MAVPNTRQEFIKYCLRKIGAPVIEINVDPDQIEDRVDEAIKLYWDYHFDGSEKVYYKHQITSTDKSNKYITLPENIIGAVQIFPITNSSIRSDDIFNIRYQIALNDLYSLTSVSLVPYYMTMEHLSLINEILVGRQPIRYNRQTDKLYIDMDWNDVQEGEFILVEAFQVVDPNAWNDSWGDRWLQNYATALIEELWGRNLTKFSGMTLPGGVQFNGEAIFQRAYQERLRLEQELYSNWSLPPEDFWG